MTPGAPPSLARRLLRGAGTVFAVQVAGTALGYLGQLALARWLGVSGYGRFAYVHTWSLLLASLAGLGLTPAALLFLPTYIERGEGRRYARFLAQACGWALGLSLLIALAILALARAGALGQYSEAWLAGAWVATRSSGASIEERWGPPLGGAMLGVSRSVNTSGKMFAFEYLRVVERDFALYYIAQPGGGPATEFVLTERTATRLVFDNPRHSYPKRIAYELSAEGVLTATVGFMKGGTPRRYEFQREGE